MDLETCLESYNLFYLVSIADVMDLPPTAISPYRSYKSVSASNPEGEPFQADIYASQITPRPVSPTTTSLNPDGSYTVRNVANSPSASAQPSISSVLHQDSVAVTQKLQDRGKLFTQHSGKFRGLRMFVS